MKKIGKAENRNFFGIAELLAKFDPVMTVHFRRIGGGENRDYYFSNTIYIELIFVTVKQLKSDS